MDLTEAQRAQREEDLNTKDAKFAKEEGTDG
jgi:hypothetical protein